MKKIITITLTVLLLAAMMLLPVNAAAGGFEAVGAAGAKPGDTVEVVLSVSGYSQVNSMGIAYEIPEGLELQSAQWIPEGTASDVSKKNEAVWMSKDAVNMTEKTPVFKLTLLVADLPEGQTEATFTVVFTKLTVENGYQKVSADPIQTVVAVELASGDMNGDGQVTDADAVYLLRFTLFGEEDYPLFAPGDVNGDGQTTDADAVYLLRFTLFGEEEYPLYPKK